MHYNYKLTIAYDGTQYSGWQIQPNGTTIQEILQQKIALILRNDVVVIGSGRTDTGVHAGGQVAHFHFHKPIDLFRFQGSLNAVLPKDIRLIEISETHEKFHAQHSAIGKTYHYHLHLDRVQDPFKRLYSLHVHDKLDLNLLKNAANLFVGTLDFTSFANDAHTGSAAQDPIRTLFRLDIISQPGGVRLEFEGNGFLYKMVRNIAGTLLEVSAGKRSIEDIELILAARDRRRAGQAAPAHGLFLMHVKYP